MDKFTEFVMGHEGEEVEALVLQKGRWPDIDVALAADTIAGRRKMRVKVPSWWECAELVYPSRLCVEQCSSEAVCEIKAKIISGVLSGRESGGKSSDYSVRETVNNEKKAGSGEGHCNYLKFRGLRIADLTGGLGVDSWAFSKMAEKVLYVERDSKLAEAAKHNFSALGCKNIEVVNAEVSSEGFVKVDGEKGGSVGVSDLVDGEKNEADEWEALRKFAPDIIYLDPARRGEGGEKVFKLEDCRPNILELRDKLLEIAELVVVKLSPMADIDEVVRQLGPTCLRADVISVDGECKEVLVTMERGYQWEGLIGVNCGKSGSFAFLRSDEASAVPHYLSLAKSKNTPDSQIKNSNPSPATKTKSQVPEPTDFSRLIGKILLEPDKAVMKAGPFKLLSERFGLVKLDVSTHYYIDDEADRAEKINGLFRRFKILRVEQLNKRTLRTIGQDYPNAEVTARNIPLSTDELRKRLGVNPSDTIHIFALRAASQNLLFITEKLQ